MAFEATDQFKVRLAGMTSAAFWDDFLNRRRMPPVTILAGHLISVGHPLGGNVGDGFFVTFYTVLAAYLRGWLVRLLFPARKGCHSKNNREQQAQTDDGQPFVMFFWAHSLPRVDSVCP